MPGRSQPPTSTPMAHRSPAPTPFRCPAPTIQFPPAATQNLASAARMQQYPVFVAPASQIPVPTSQFPVPSPYRPCTPPVLMPCPTQYSPAAAATQYPGFAARMPYPTATQYPGFAALMPCPTQYSPASAQYPGFAAPMPCPTQYSPAASQYPGFVAPMLCRPPGWMPCQSPAPMPCQSNQCPTAQYPAPRHTYSQFVAPPLLWYPVFAGMPLDSPILPESLTPTVEQYASARVYTENFQVAKRKCTQEDTTTLRTTRQKLNMNGHTNKLKKTCFEGVFVLETEDSAPVDVYCNASLNRFRSALQTVSNQEMGFSRTYGKNATQEMGFSRTCGKNATQEMVFSRTYGKNEGAQLYFDKLKSIKHINILEPLIFLENDVSDVITFPTVQCTLRSYIEMNSDLLWNRSTQNTEGTFKPKLIDILRTVAETIDFIHTKNIYHGLLHVDNIYMAFKDGPQNAVVKLVLSGFETKCKDSGLLSDAVLLMRRDLDWKGFQKLVVEVVGLLDPIYMQKRNGRNEIVHLASQKLGESALNYVLESPALLTTDKKVMLMLCLNSSKFQEQYAGKMCQDWTMKFSNVLSSIDEAHNIYCGSTRSNEAHNIYCGSTRSNEAAPLNSMASFLQFCYNMVFHFVKLTPAAKLYLGGSIETALQQFEKVYPGLFVDIVEYLRSEELLEIYFPSEE